MTPATWLEVALAGALGAMARFGLDRAISRRARGEFPLGTLTINVSGSLLLGLLTGLVLYHGLGPSAKLVLGAGFCGAYTTFSTMTYESLALVEDRQAPAAAFNLLANTGLGLAAAAAGLVLAAAL